LRLHGRHKSNPLDHAADYSFEKIGKFVLKNANPLNPVLGAT